VIISVRITTIENQSKLELPLRSAFFPFSMNWLNQLAKRFAGGKKESATTAAKIVP
jgi:hypothetical protein